MPETALAVQERNLELAQQKTSAIVQQASAYLEPIGIDPQFFSQAAVTALTRNPDLLEADPQSLKLALLKCAQRGLMPDGESAVLVVFNKQVSLIPMYGGMMDIVRRNMPGISAVASVVRTWDDFRVKQGSHPVLEHGPNPLPEGKTIADLNKIEHMVGAYCVVTLPGGHREITWMPKHEILRIRSGVKSSSNPKSPWRNHPARMFEKTAIRAAMRRLPSRNQIFAAYSDQRMAEFTPGPETVIPAPQQPALPPAKALLI